METKLHKPSLTPQSLETQESLMEAGNLRANNLQSHPKPLKPKGFFSRTWARYVNNDHQWLEKHRGILIVAALLVAGIAFHAGVNPPGGTITNTQNGRYELGNAVQTEVDMEQFDQFVTYNTLTMIISLGIVVILISGFSLKNKFLIWVLTVGTLFGMVCMVGSYYQSLAMMAPDMYVDATSVWICLIWILGCGVVGLIHTVLFVVWVVMKLFKRKMPEIETKGNQINV